jgi:hypothetical protein
MIRVNFEILEWGGNARHEVDACVGESAKAHIDARTIAADRTAT